MSGILAIETSCDDTSAAVISNGAALSNIISSQYIHRKYSGIVPELASRAHIQIISTIVSEALEEAKLDATDLDALAVTSEPGLVGSLIVGSNFAKGLAIKYGLPLIPVNHIEGHIYSGCLEDKKFGFPFITLVVSGGHTALFLVKSYSEYEILGLTRDDAAGEAFDKTASLLGLPYPGGPEIDNYARKGNPTAYDFPRGMIDYKNYDFSFSGLKTSVRYFLSKNFPDGLPEEKLPDLCASAQAAIVDVLVKKTVNAAIDHGIKNISIAGGVSANSYLRSRIEQTAKTHNFHVSIPDLLYCVDNGAMIGFIAEKKLEEAGIGDFGNLTFKVNPTALRAPKMKKKKN